MSILARFALVLVLFICLRGSEGGVQTPPSWVSGGAAAAATKYQTITVDQSGGGNYTTIQSAIDAIPFDNMQWICVYVKTGIYKYVFFSILFFFFVTNLCCFSFFFSLAFYIQKLQA
ncbi:putative pectinesterase [Helianthus annuus]|nr:putative pectinesterase [Helianthus annuus]